MRIPEEAVLQQVYGETTESRARFESLAGHFTELFGKEEMEFFSAPGRTEIVGNHTDHNGGKILAASISLDTIGAAAPNGTDIIEIVSEGYQKKVVVDLSALERVPKNCGTVSLVAGMAEAARKKGFAVSGFQAYVSTKVISAAGVSSSASFEMLICSIINYFFNNGKISYADYAKIGQYAENMFFGKPCGLMDQMASSVGGVVSIDFENTAHPAVEQLDVDLHAYGYALCILDSGAGHEDLTNEYSAITNELRAVCRVFDKEVLREVPEEAFLAELPKVRAAAGDRAVNRAFHVYAENRRALAEKEALRQGDFDKFLALVRESGRSSAMYLQNVIPTGSTAAQELMVTIALCERILEGRGAVRVHGGGFGGTAQAFVPLDMLDTFKKATEAALGQDCCHVVMIRPAGGVRLG